MNLFYPLQVILGMLIFEELDEIKSESEYKHKHKQNIVKFIKNYERYFTVMYNDSFQVNEELTVKTNRNLHNLIILILTNHREVNSNIFNFFIDTIDLKNIQIQEDIDYQIKLNKNYSSYYRYFLFKLFFEYNKNLKDTQLYLKDLNSINQISVFYRKECDKEIIEIIDNILSYISILDVNKMLLMFELIKNKFHVKLEETN